MELLLQGVSFLPEPRIDKLQTKTNIVIEDNMITEISPRAKLPDPEFQIQGRRLIVLPPPINSHTHLPMTLLRGYSDNKPLFPWLQDVWEIEGKFDASWITMGTKLAALEMIKSGTGGAADFYFHESKIGAVLAQAGLRGWLGSGVLPSAFVDQGGIEFQLMEFRRALDLANTSPLLEASIAPHSQSTVDAETILKTADLAEKHSVPIMIHASETRKEVLESEEKHKAPPVERLDQLGFFRDEVDAILAHCTWITQREVEILGKHESIVGWCPVSSQKLAYGGVTPIPELLKANATVAIGTDGSASNNTLDLWREMRNAANVISAHRWDPALYTAEQALNDTCWALRERLKPRTLIGKKNPQPVADLVIMDFHKPHLIPSSNVISNLVYAANGSDTHSLIVNGQLLMYDRRVLTINEEEVLHDLEQKLPELYGNGP
ncbi:MAG: amidohydrolase family protein [Candidatus Thorarchaeota archaeon]